jgi:membrane protease YdiL (CAAX protease family)
VRLPIPWDFVVVLVVLAIAVPWRGYVRVKQLLLSEQTSTSERLVLYASTIAFQWILTILILWRSRAHGYDPAELGIAIPRLWTAIVATIVLTAAVTANQLASIRRLASLPREKQGSFRALSLKLMPQNFTERLVFFALVSTVAVCEEILYRGWAQSLFQVVSGSVVIAILASALLFSVAHVYQGRRGMVATFIVGAVFSAVRAWTGSLVPTMVAHFAADLAAGFLAPKWLNADVPKPHHSDDHEISASTHGRAN